MRISDNVILITGGASGIGYALARRFVESGSRVLLCGRNEQRLREAADGLQGASTRMCDITSPKERVALIEWAIREFPELNVLINNAGVQHRMNVLKGDPDWALLGSELDTNFAAPVHLSLLLGRHLASRKDPAVINVTSGLAFTPMAAAPVYSATKAAMHSFSISLRAQLAPAGIQVIEIAPPAVDTDLGGKGVHTYGVPLDEFADSVMRDLEAGKEEIGYGTSAKALRMSRDEIDATVAGINERLPVPSE